MEQLQSHIWLTASSYLAKYLRSSSYMTLQLLHFLISFNMRKIWLSFFISVVYLNESLLGTSDFDAQMSGIKIWKGDEILRPVYKKPFSEILSVAPFWAFFSS